MDESELLTPELLASIEEGAKEGTKAGPLEGYPMDDVVLTLENFTWEDGKSQPSALRSPPVSPYAMQQKRPVHRSLSP